MLKHALGIAIADIGITNVLFATTITMFLKDFYRKISLLKSDSPNLFCRTSPKRVSVLMDFFYYDIMIFFDVARYEFACVPRKGRERCVQTKGLIHLLFSRYQLCIQLQWPLI